VGAASSGKNEERTSVYAEVMIGIVAAGGFMADECTLVDMRGRSGMGMVKG
jgi:hypothetical protein